MPGRKSAGQAPHRLAFPTGTWAWLITRYDDAVTALNHPALVKSPFAEKTTSGCVRVWACRSTTGRRTQRVTGELVGAIKKRGHGDLVIDSAEDTDGAKVLETVLRRLPTARLAVPEEELAWWPGPITRGLFHLPIEL